jgi:predicted Zn-dependent peptidase
MESEFYKTKLENGLVILFEKRRLPITNIMYSSRFGSAYEPSRLKGIAHLIEHMLFKGTKNRSQKEIAGTIERVGGVFNAFTAQQQTTFWIKVPSNYSDLGFEILSDMVLNPLFDERELKKEKNVILEEQKRWHDIPENYIFIKIKEALYKSPFGLSPFGSKQTLERISRDALVKFHNNNSSKGILTVVGNEDFGEIMEDAKRKFSIKKSVLESKLAINKTNRAIIEKRAGLDQIHLALAVHMPSLSDKRRYGAEIMSTILGGGMSSRLWQEVREKLGIAYSIHSLVEQEMSYGSLIIYAGINKDYQNKVREVILKEIKKLQDLKEKELEEAKEQLIGNFSLENENGINTAQHLALNEMAMEAEEFYRYPERISEVKLEDVKKLAKIKKYSFVALAPK